MHAAPASSGATRSRHTGDRGAAIASASVPNSARHTTSPALITATGETGATQDDRMPGISAAASDKPATRASRSPARSGGRVSMRSETNTAQSSVGWSERTLRLRSSVMRSTSCQKACLANRSSAPSAVRLSRMAHQPSTPSTDHR